MGGVSAYGAAGATLALAVAALVGALVGGLASRATAKFVRIFRRREAVRQTPSADGRDRMQLFESQALDEDSGAACPHVGCPVAAGPDMANSVAEGSESVPHAAVCHAEGDPAKAGFGKDGFTARSSLACVLGAAYFASVVGAYGLGVHALALCALGGILLSMALVDLDASVIPNRLVLAGIAVWAATFAFWDVEAGSLGIGGLVVGMAGSPWLAVLIDGLAGAFLVAGVALVLSLALDMATGRPSLGGGDVKLLFMVGLFLGVAGSVLSLMVACAVGVVFWLATRNVRTGAPGQADSGATRDSHAFPFGPSIALATWFTLIAGPSILNWYFGVL